MKPGSAERRGRKSEIGTELWPELQRLERAGRSLNELMAWLAAERGIQVSKPTMSRVMAKVRAAAPVPEPPPQAPELEPATDDDELLTVRKFARHQMQKGECWKAQQGGAALLLRIIELRRKKQPTAPPPDQTGAQAAATSSPPPEELPAPLTPEQEAEMVRQQLGKRAQA